MIRWYGMVLLNLCTIQEVDGAKQDNCHSMNCKKKPAGMKLQQQAELPFKEKLGNDL